MHFPGTKRSSVSIGGGGCAPRKFRVCAVKIAFRNWNGEAATIFFVQKPARHFVRRDICIYSAESRNKAA